MSLTAASPASDQFAACSLTRAGFHGFSHDLPSDASATPAADCGFAEATDATGGAEPPAAGAETYNTTAFSNVQYQYTEAVHTTKLPCHCSSLQKQARVTQVVFKIFEQSFKMQTLSYHKRIIVNNQ